MNKKTPRQKINELSILNGTEGFYGKHNQFSILIKSRLYTQATKIMNSLNQGFLWSNERLVHSTIYDNLLDSVSVKDIKLKFI